GAIKRSSSALPRIDATQVYPFGIVKILDMGLARCTDPFTGQTATHLTQIGSVMGTPEYIAPEQARDSHTSDIRADLYSLGCTFYDLLAGNAPFPEGTAVQKVKAHMEQTPRALSDIRADVPPELTRVVERMMAKDPAQRF